MTGGAPDRERQVDSRIDDVRDVIVLGGGAAGLMCAAVAAHRGRRVLVLERTDRVGKKILMSGGGRCNFTNRNVDADDFVSANPHFCTSALKQYSQWDFLALVERHGLDHEERARGQLFCRRSARDLLRILLAECESGGVEIRTRCDVRKVAALAADGSAAPAEADGGGPRYSLECRLPQVRRRLAARSLVVATGALSIPALGGSGFGYTLAEQFGLPLVERRAGLVPFMFGDAMKALCGRLSGLAIEVDIGCGAHRFRESMLFTHRGLSGPAVLQISNYWHPGDEIVVDLLPGVDAVDLLLSGKRRYPTRRLKTVLHERLPTSLVIELQDMWWPESADTALTELGDARLQDIAQRLHHWSLKPSATEGYRTAEVTLGGVDTVSLSSKTMEARRQPGLYFIGEVVDVTGRLGGFNLQWAWSSGYCAGMAA